MGLLNKAQEREKQLKTKKPLASASSISRNAGKRASAPQRGLLNRATHREKELKTTTTTRLSSEIEKSKIDIIKGEKFEEKETNDIKPLDSRTVLSTVIDKIYHHVKEVKSMKLSQIEKVFNLSREQVEQWASILDEEKLLELFYPAMGDAILRVPEVDVGKRGANGKKGAKEKGGKGGKDSGKTTATGKGKGKNTGIIAVSVVFSIVLAMMFIYVLKPEMLNPIINILNPIINYLKYSFGKITLLVSNLLGR